MQQVQYPKEEDAMNQSRQDKLQLLGRLLFGVLFIVAGVRKSMAFAGSAAYMAKNGVPMAEELLVLTLILEIGGGLLLVLGWHTRLIAAVLALFVVVVTPIFHGFWTFEPALMANQLNHFIKNCAVVGGLLYVWAHGAGGISMDARAVPEFEESDDS